MSRSERRSSRRSGRHSEQRSGRRTKRQSEETPRSQKPQQKQKRQRKPVHIDALDGLRSIAIVAVILYHLAVPWLPSGHMGVVMFLVLTGYLASSTVLKTIRHEGSLSLPRLWGKRIVRIWPSMATMIAVVVALCVAFNHILLTKLRPDLLPSLLLSNNIGAILRGASYFDNLGGTSPLTHLWYLGVDFQFFVVWTALASILCPNGRSTRVGRTTAMVLALGSAVLMAVLYDPNADPTRVYYGPDTRAFAPLLGAWLGLAWPLGGRPVRLDAARHTLRSFPLSSLSPLALAALVVIMVVVPDTSPLLYRGGMFLVAVLTVVVVIGALERRSALSRALSLKPLVWLGTRSYGLYLWHFPLFQLFKVTNNSTSPLMIALAVALSLVAAELSLRLVEQPLAKKQLPFVFGGGSNDDVTGPVRYLAMVPVALVTIALATGITGLLTVPPETALPDDAINNTGVGAAEAIDLSNKKNGTDKTNSSDATEDSSKSNSSSYAKDEKSSTTSSKNKDSDKGKDEDEAKNSDQDLDDLETGSITLEASEESVSEGLYTPVIIADSVAGDADWYFGEHAPDALLDSYVGRRPDQALSVLQGYLDQDVVGDIVVLDSFSNVPADEATMTSLIEACGNRRVYLVNVRIPEVEQDQINKMLARFAEEYDNVTLIDWYSYSEGHDDWIYPDGEHLTPEGQPYYVDLITNAIARDFAKLGGTVLGEGEKSSRSTASRGQIINSEDVVSDGSTTSGVEDESSSGQGSG